MEFYRQTLDDQIYRKRRGRVEILKDGQWTPIVPSEQDYDHMRLITEEEAAPTGRAA